MINKAKVVNSHFNLGESFYHIATPAKFPNHILRFRNDRAAELLDLDNLSDNQWVKFFGKFAKLPGINHEPMALKYHGHQFGYYNPDLGDGRGFLIAQFLDKNNVLWDLGTKGSGQTKYSRGGDGRLTLKGAVRELLATEFLTSLGVPTSQTFSIIETAEELQRNDEPSPTRSAVLVRRSNSHIRIGTFQRLRYFNEYDNIALLLNHLSENYFTNIKPQKNTVLLMVGGNSKKQKPDYSEYFELSTKVIQGVKKLNAQLIVTVSRRTPNRAIKILQSTFSKHLKDFNILSSDENKLYPKILEIIDYTIVTSDSVNMISELATLSKPLFIFHFSKKNRKISFFISNLKELNIVQDYYGNLYKFEKSKLQTNKITISQVNKFFGFK